MANPGIILLAAGFSKRYMQATGKHKLLEEIPGSGQTLFQHSLSGALRANMPVLVVLRSEAQALQTICKRLNTAYICLESLCMGDSIAAGVKATDCWGGWIITLADLPYIAQQTYMEIAQSVRDGVCARPVYLGQPGHPVGFPPKMRTSLIKLQGADGAKGLLTNHSLHLVNVKDSGCIWDIDLPEHFVLSGRGE